MRRRAPSQGALTATDISNMSFHSKGVSLPIDDIDHDGQHFYGVCGTRQLLQSSPGQAKINADRYAWMAQVCTLTVFSAHLIQCLSELGALLAAQMWNGILEAQVQVTWT
jgi:hypothetical protein